MFKLLTIVVFISAISNVTFGNIVELNPDNFYSVVETSNKLWIIKYYVPWCGFCLKFEPTFVSFTELSHGWEFIGFGQISCTSYSALCSSHGSPKTPNVKLYLPSPHGIELKPMYHGVGLYGVNKLMDNLMERMEEEEEINPHNDQKVPRLKSIEDLTDIDFNRRVSTFLIVEKLSLEFTRITKLVIMDVYRYRSRLKVYRTSIDSAKDGMMLRTPGLYRIIKNDSHTEKSLLMTAFLRPQMRQAILTTAGITEDDFKRPSQTPTGETKIDLRVNESTYIYRRAHGLHMEDLITNLRYSLWNEISLSAEIDQRSHLALVKYLRILIQFHPSGEHVIKFLKLILDWMGKNPAPITSQRWMEVLSSLESTDAYIPSNTTWKGCNGSQEHFKGYPCSLWMTFHTLTVRAYLDKNISIIHVNRTGMTIQLAIRSYVNNFFSCEECSQNFMHSTRDWLTQVQEEWSPKRTVLDLWRRHNSVNGRLHLQPINEDPLSPKIQFPSFQDCRRCRRDSKMPISVFTSSPSDWDEEEVLRFLVRYYGGHELASCGVVDLNVILILFLIIMWIYIVLDLN